MLRTQLHSELFIRLNAADPANPQRISGTMHNIKLQPKEGVFDELGDVVLLVGTNGHSFRVSSHMLITFSRIFRVMLRGHFKEAVDLKTSSNEPYKLKLPDDDGPAMLVFCQIMYHQAKSPFGLLAGSVTEGRMEIEKVYEQIMTFRKLAKLCDKYETTNVCVHYCQNYMTHFLKWTDKDSYKQDAFETHLKIRVALCEIAWLLKDDSMFRRATKLLVWDSCNSRAVDDWKVELEKQFDGLPSQFWSLLASHNINTWQTLNADVTRLRDFLSLGQHRITDDIKATRVHGFFPSFRLRRHEELTHENFEHYHTNYLLGSHDVMLMAGFSTAINSVFVQPVYAKAAITLSCLMEQLRKVKIVPFATLKSVNPESRKDTCRACVFDVDTCLTKILDSATAQIEGMCLKCAFKGTDDCSWHEEEE